MKSYDLVAQTIRGQNKTGVTPIYGWVFDNVVDKIQAEFGSLHSFEDHYQFDMAHIFGGPEPYPMKEIQRLQSQGTEITPELLLQLSMTDPNLMVDYQTVQKDLQHQRGSRERFCYMQTKGIFECLNDVFGIENHLCYMLLYPEELAKVYQRQAAWNIKFIHNIIDLGIDMIHISDDWGTQNSLMFSPDHWWEYMYPNHKKMIEEVKKRNTLVSLHSDGNINQVLDGIVELGFDLIHPYQETAKMSYDVYLDKYQDKFALLGGVCIQSTLGFGDYDRLEKEIRRVFGLLKNKRWICCTTHIVQPECSIEELKLAYDLILALSGK